MTQKTTKLELGWVFDTSRNEKRYRIRDIENEKCILDTCFSGDVANFLLGYLETSGPVTIQHTNTRIYSSKEN